MSLLDRTDRADRPGAPQPAGTAGLRDLGGLPAAEGRTVRPGRFLRGPCPGSGAGPAGPLPPGPLLLVDFRSPAEVAEDPPGPAAPETERRHLPVEPRTARRLIEATGGGALTEAAAEAAMVATYRDFVRESFRAFAEFLRLVGRREEGAVFFHCTAGKDRTGFAAALLLTALGTPREAVMADYLRTNLLWRPPEALVARLPEPARGPFLSARAAYLDAAFDELARRHGGAELFVRDALGGREAHRAWLLRHTLS